MVFDGLGSFKTRKPDLLLPLRFGLFPFAETTMNIFFSRNVRPPARQCDQRRDGIILLIVLGALTFFSILLATYLAFSRHSKATSLAIAKRNTQQPDTTRLMTDALMLLIRGTNDGSSPFYGEDLLSDYYGRKDAADLVIHNATAAANQPQISDSGFIRFPISADGTNRPTALAAFPFDDVYSGRLISFTEGPLQFQTFSCDSLRVRRFSPGSRSSLHRD